MNGGPDESKTTISAEFLRADRGGGRRLQDERRKKREKKEEYGEQSTERRDGNVGQDGKCSVVGLYVFGSKDERRFMLLSRLSYAQFVFFFFHIRSNAAPLA